MAKLASRRKAQLDVVYRRGRAVIIVQMTGDACRICAGQAVIVIDVAIGAHARRNGVGIGERESRCRVIEFSVRPGDGVVAAVARGGESELRMIDGCRGGVVVI